jgi:predicted PurR-regulated permease PerM
VFTPRLNDEDRQSDSRAAGARPISLEFVSRKAAPGLFVIAVIFLLREAAPLLVPIATAILLTFLLAKPLRFLRRHGVPDFVGAAFLVGALLGATVLLAATLAQPANEWWDRAPAALEEVAQRWERVRDRIPGLGIERPAAVRAAPRASPPADPVKEKIVSESVALTGVLIGRVLSFGLAAAATVILLYFLLASEQWLLSRTLAAIPSRRARASVLGGVRSAQREIGIFIGAQAVINCGIGVATALAMDWIGVPSPLLWACMAALLNFIPYVGPILVSGMLLLVGIVSFSAEPALILAPASAFLALHAIESNFVTPWFVGRQLSLSRISVVLSVLFWGWMWGIAGAVLAVPILIGIRNVCKRRRSLRRVCVYLDGEPGSPPSLRTLLRLRGRATPQVAD